MNFNIDKRYVNAIQTFTFVELTDDSSLPISSTDFDALVKEVSLKIISASDLKPTISQLAQCDLSLHEVCYIIVQQTDGKSGTDTVSRIENASSKEKIILSYAIKKLAEDFANLENFVNLTNEDVKTFTLLFGIQRTHEFAAEKIVAFSPQLSEIEEIEATLVKLKNLRDQHPAVLPEETPEPIKLFIAKVDATIKEHTERLAILKESFQSTTKTI